LIDRVAAREGGRLRLALVLFAILAVASVGSIGLRASRGASITGDEPFYLLTTQSLLDDGDLDLTQQYEARSFRVFFDHPDGLWRQSVPRDDGVLLSPHNPGLSILAIPGFAIAGLVGVQVELLLLNALAFALGFVLVVRLVERTSLAWWSTLGVGLSATAFVYSTEVYPEAPAALALVVAVLLTLGPRPGAWRGGAIVAACSAIPWLGVKYAPLAAIVAGVALWRATARGRIAIATLGVASAVAFVAFHLAVFDGLTPYGMNSVYAGGTTGEIVADHVAFGDRLYRIWGLFIDRRFGIGRWAPLLLLVVPGIVVLLRRAWRERLVAALVLCQIGIAAFVAITMMGWWFPGRTMMTVFPLLGAPVAAFVAVADRWGRRLAIALGAWTAAITLSLAIGGHRGEVVVAVDPFELGALPFRALEGLFPGYTTWTAGTVALTVLWLTIAAVAVAVAWVLPRRPAGTPVAPPPVARPRDLSRAGA
jgi:hypothetical protein